jgi:hypothetical protein
MAKIFKTNAETKLATAKKLGIALGVVEVRARNYPPLIQPRRQAPVACTDVRVPGMCVHRHCGVCVRLVWPHGSSYYMCARAFALP